MRLALRSGLYREHVSEKLAAAGLEASQLWPEAREEVIGLLAAEDGRRAVAALECLFAWPPAPGFASHESEMETLLSQARAIKNREQIRSAIAAIRARPDDAEAAQTLVNLGAESAPAAERALCEVLQAILPEWQGFIPGAGPAEKLKALANARQAGLSDPKTSG
jgi:hypothetical protein